MADKKEKNKEKDKEKIVEKKIKKLNKKVNKEKYESDEQHEIKHFIFTILIVIVFVVAVYGVSKLLIDEPALEVNNETTEGEINYDIVSVGTMFNRPETEYYVAVYDGEKPEAIVYSSIINNYVQKADSLRVYYCNLGTKLNESFYAGEGKESNPNAKTIEDLAFGDFTLVKIKNGKIVKYWENVEDMKKEWNV